MTRQQNKNARINRRNDDCEFHSLPSLKMVLRCTNFFRGRDLARRSMWPNVDAVASGGAPRLVSQRRAGVRGPNANWCARFGASASHAPDSVRVPSAPNQLIPFVFPSRNRRRASARRRAALSTHFLTFRIYFSLDNEYSSTRWRREECWFLSATERRAHNWSKIGKVNGGEERKKITENRVSNKRSTRDK